MGFPDFKELRRAASARGSRGLAAFLLILECLVELFRHRLLSWVNEKLDKGVSPMLTILGEILSWIGGNRIIFILLLAATYCVVVVAIAQIRAAKGPLKEASTGGFHASAGHRLIKDPASGPRATSLQPAQAETHGASSPATAIGSIGTIGAGARVVIGPGGNRAPTASQLFRPEIMCRGLFTKECKLPFVGDGGLEIELAQCTVVAFRNDSVEARSVADDVVVHMDFVRESGGDLVAINEAWWREDIAPTTSSFYIGRGETKHVVVSTTADGKCKTLEKEFVYGLQRSMLTAIDLADGRWKVKLDFRARDFSQSYYFSGVVNEGDAQWTTPSITPPSDWDAQRTVSN